MLLVYKEPSHRAGISVTYVQVCRPENVDVCNKHITFQLRWTRILKKQFAVHETDRPVTLKQGQGHQTWYGLVDPKHGFHNAQFQLKSDKNIKIFS